jgi:hypothetical protein
MGYENNQDQFYGLSGELVMNVSQIQNTHQFKLMKSAGRFAQLKYTNLGECQLVMGQKSLPAQQFGKITAGKKHLQEYSMPLNF